MVIQWNGDFAERKFVGKLLADYGGTGKGFKSILSLPLFEALSAVGRLYGLFNIYYNCL
jgi:hypothetical protein